MEEETDTYLCPGCDREVRVGSRGCPYCNPPAKRQLRKKQRPKAAAKHDRESWEQEPGEDGLDLPKEDFDYNDFVAREFGHRPHRKVGIAWYWWATAVVLLVLMILGGIGLWR